jgi:hypothetical protein
MSHIRIEELWSLGSQRERALPGNRRSNVLEEGSMRQLDTTVYEDGVGQVWVLAWVHEDELDQRAGDMPVPLDRLGPAALT